MTIREAERLRDLARMQFVNASWFAEEVRHNLGALDPSYVYARAVREDARRKLVAALDVLVDLLSGRATR